MTEHDNPALTILLARLRLQLAEPVDFTRTDPQTTVAKVQPLSAAAIYFNVADVGGALEQNFRLRATADYRMDHVPELQAARALRRAEAFVAAVAWSGGRRQ